MTGASSRRVCRKVRVDVEIPQLKGGIIRIVIGVRVSPLVTLLDRALQVVLCM